MAFLVGASRELIDLARRLGHDLEGIVDTAEVGEEVDGCPVLGDDDWLFEQDIPSRRRKVIISPDKPKTRAALFEKYDRKDFDIIRLVVGTVRTKVKIGRGSVLQSPSHVSVGCTIGKGVRINCGANVMHDASVGDFTTVAPNAVLLGHVNIEDEVYVGANATILPNIDVGEEAVVGAGAVVTRDVPAGETVKGVPAK